MHLTMVDEEALGRFSPSTSVSPATHSTDCYTLIIIIIIIIIINIIYHLSSRTGAIGQTVADVPVDSVSPHPKKLKK
jgi:hypothetical protein